MRFEWQTDDDETWDRQPKRIAGGRSRRRLLLGLLFLCSLVVTSLVVIRRQERMVAAAAEAELLASHALVQQAGQTGDEELFLHLLMGNDKEWVGVERALLAKDLLFSHALRPFGLTPTDRSEVVDARLQPNLRAAEVVTDYHYEVSLPGREPTSVTLRQTHYYRRGQERWLLARSGVADAGGTFVESGEHVTVRYDEVDEAFAHSLLALLEEKAALVCAAVGEACPPSLFVRVRLDRNPRGLLVAASDPLEVTPGSEVQLPAPSIAGVPLDKAATDALAYGYAARVVAVLLVESLDYRCCEQRSYFATLLARELLALGLPSPETEAYETTVFVDDIITLPRLNEIWWGRRLGEPPTELERRQLAAFADFLLEIGDERPGALLAAIPRANGFWDWLRRHTPYDPTFEQDLLTNAWVGFVLARANASQDDRIRPPWPAQNLALICEDEVGERGLYLYDLAADEWRRQRRLAWKAPALFPTEDDRALVLYDKPYPEYPSSPPRLWRVGEELPLPAELLPLVSVTMDPLGRYLTMQRGTFGDADRGVALLDVANCGKTGGCLSHAVPDIPYWSPDGTFVLVWDAEQHELLLGRRELDAWYPTGVSVAGEPFWLDETTFGYLAEGGETVDVRRVASAPLGTSTIRETLFTLESLESVLAPASSGRPWQIVEAVALPHTPPQFLVALGLPYSASRNYLLVTPMEDGEDAVRVVSYLSHFWQIASLELLVGDEGHLLAFYPAAEAGVDVGLILFDLVADRRILEADGPFFYYGRGMDWSQDARWLARTGHHFVELIGATRVEGTPVYRHFVATVDLQCSSVAWLTLETRGDE